MVRTTRKQREALKRIYLRVVAESLPLPVPGKATAFSTPTYREFRAKVQPTFGCDNAVMVPFAGMWLGIETDGYAHS